MANTNNFLAFAIGSSANVLSQTDYADLDAVTNGFSSGTALSEQLNKVWRQSSVISNVIGQFIADHGYDALDDEDTATLLSNFESALVSYMTDNKNVTFTDKSAAYTAVASDIGTSINATGEWTLSLTAAATLGNGWWMILANSGSGTITIDPDGSETINGETSWSIFSGKNAVLMCDGTSFYTIESQRSDVVATTGVLSGITSYGTESSSIINVSADQVTLENDNGQFVRLTGISGLTGDLSASGAGGIDTGSATVSTWYAMFIISDKDANYDLLFSLSETSPTLPTGYDFYTRIGWIRTDSSTATYPLAYSQHNKDFYYTADKYEVTSGIQSWPTTVDISDYVPPTAYAVNLSIHCYFTNAIYIGATSAHVAFSKIDTEENGQIPMYLPLVVAQQITWGSSAAADGVSILGWVDQ